MRLYLIQHGLALPESIDQKKGLSEKGIIQTQKMAELFRTKDLEVDLIWHSKKLRAIQTAQIFSQYILDAKIEQRDDLNPQDPIVKFPQQLEALDKHLMIVGHLPFLQKLAARLLVNSTVSDLIFFRNSGVVCLEYIDRWKILWMVNPDLYL